MSIRTTFIQNIENGPIVTEYFSGEARLKGDCNLDMYGNYRSKAEDKVLVDQSIQKSKIKGGNGWQRGYMLL